LFERLLRELRRINARTDDKFGASSGLDGRLLPS